MTDSNLIWVDVETTGLDPARDFLLEVAFVVTDADLTPGYAFTAVLPASMPADMDPTVLEMHTKNGLIEECAKARASFNEVWVARVLRERAAGAPLAGSTVSFDRAFLRAFLPEVEAVASYRNVDVSSVKELVKRWRPEVYEARPQGPKVHRALPDVLASIEELRYYRRALGW